MSDKTKITVLGVLYAGGLLCLISLRPDNAPLLLLLIPFIFIFVVLYLTIELLTRRIFSFQARTSRNLSLVLSTFSTLLLVMRSITQLTLRDVLLSVVIASMLTWYIAKLSST